MIVVRFKVKCQAGKSDAVMEAFKKVISPSRAVPGVLKFDIGRDVADCDSFVATEVFEDRAALEAQEALPEIAQIMTILEDSLASEPEATIFTVASSEPWGE